jgi:hypothetical protein
MALLCSCYTSFQFPSGLPSSPSCASRRGSPRRSCSRSSPSTRCEFLQFDECSRRLTRYFCRSPYFLTNYLRLHKYDPDMYHSALMGLMGEIACFEFAYAIGLHVSSRSSAGAGLRHHQRSKLIEHPSHPMIYEYNLIRERSLFGVRRVSDKGGQRFL